MFVLWSKPQKFIFFFNLSYPSRLALKHLSPQMLFLNLSKIFSTNICVLPSFEPPYPLQYASSPLTLPTSVSCDSSQFLSNSSLLKASSVVTAAALCVPYINSKVLNICLIVLISHLLGIRLLS